MKLHTILAIAVGLTASPLFAQTQLEKSVGVDAGTLTVAEIVQLRNAMEQDNRDGSAIKVRQLKEKAGAFVTRAAR